jgi:hypothetical protein
MAAFVQKYLIDVDKWQKIGDAGIFPPDSSRLE